MTCSISMNFFKMPRGFPLFFLFFTRQSYILNMLNIHVIFCYSFQTYSLKLSENKNWCYRKVIEKTRKKTEKRGYYDDFSNVKDFGDWNQFLDPVRSWIEGRILRWLSLAWIWKLLTQYVESDIFASLIALDDINIDHALYFYIFLSDVLWSEEETVQVWGEVFGRTVCLHGANGASQRISLFVAFVM